jgi:hypothetical protein
VLLGPQKTEGEDTLGIALRDLPADSGGLRMQLIELSYSFTALFGAEGFFRSAMLPLGYPSLPFLLPCIDCNLDRPFNSYLNFDPSNPKLSFTSERR